MKLSTTFFMLATIAASANAECGKWSFKCSTTVWMCGVEETGTCEDGGGNKGFTFKVASSEDCQGMIDAVTNNNYMTYKCPVEDGEKEGHEISHWSNYCKGEKCDVLEDGGLFCVDKKCPEPEPPIGGGGGDPHFRTYDGTSYNYHGECDLVMARSKEFGPDKVNLDLHIRTKSMGTWSLISNAALRIGMDVLEFENDNTIYINGAEAILPYAMNGRYGITKDVAILEETSEDGEVEMVDRHEVLVDLGKGEQIRIANYKGMISVRVKAYMADTEGMLGIHGSKGMVSRDGSVLKDENAMGLMWQVRDTEAMLFREIRFPQYPVKCTPPSVDGRRLRISGAERERAEKACAGIDDYSRNFCIEDVLLTGDVKVATGYMFGEAF